MKFRWTIKQLKEFTDNEFLQGLIEERRSGLSNQYSPLAEKLKKLYYKYDNMVREDRKKANSKTREDVTEEAKKLRGANKGVKFRIHYRKEAKEWTIQELDGFGRWCFVYW